MGNYIQIEIDQEIYDYLLKHSESFQDTPNSVIRRLLLRTHNMKTKNSKFKNQKIYLLQHPSHIPSALTQILDLVYLIKKFKISRREATNIIAENRNVYPQTIIDKYCRQLNLKANQVDKILGTDMEEFYKIIMRKFFSHKSYINTFITEELNTVINDNIAKNFSPNSYRDGFISVKDLKNKSAEDLVNIKPEWLLIGDEKYNPKTWADLDEIVVKELFKLGFLSVDKLPIRSSKQKFFINTRPSHENVATDGEWKKILPGVYIDVKYNVQRHCQNIYNLLEELKIDKSLQLLISLRQ